MAPLVRDAHYLKDPDKLEIIKNAGPALVRAKEEGFSFHAHQSIRDF